MTKYRQEEAYRIRVAAAAIARDRKHPNHHANGDEQRYAAANYAMCFTKGLRHKASNGLIIDKEDFERFRAAIDDGFIDAFTTRVRVSSGKGRPWEAPTAGVTYDLEGPDPQAVTMAPAPALGSDELAYEMAEVYELALLRDEPLTAFVDGSTNAAVNAAVNRLDALDYAATREQFGQQIGKFQGVSFQIADMITEIDAADLLTLAAADRLDRDLPANREIASAKLYASEMLARVTDAAIQIHGGMGMTDELAIGHYFKRLTVFDSEFGNVDHHMKRHIALATG